ncbi:MAG: hypothetical protein QF415_07295 [Candidatus Undinarchaeales archaeon]|jgi:hypothetical protein|nr:hypothetical protein [Candidatus Undinarchaeales archaeon]MDP7493803.1 hypothetical protein [Candidatus Undinarchaeales archaeon]
MMCRTNRILALETSYGSDTPQENVYIRTRGRPERMDADTDDGARPLPTLEFTDSDLVDLMLENVDEDTLIVTGSHGYPLVSEFGQAVMVDNNSADRVEEIREEYQYSKVLAYGGCTALDVARAVAVGKELVVIPASIATSGISVDKSILNYGGEDRAERTMAPSRSS